MLVTGGCLCGAIRYEAQGPLRYLTHCYCSMCRRAHGAMFATFGAAKREQFRLLSGSGELRTYRNPPNVQRSFCGTCGSTLFWERIDQPKYISIAVGTVAGDPGSRPLAHIYVGSKAEWWEITDHLPQYEEEPTSLSDPFK